MMGPYGCLTKAIHEKHTHKDISVWILRSKPYAAGYMVLIIILLFLEKENQVCDHLYDITGSLCENNDKLQLTVIFRKIDMGDYLVIHDTGAHGFSMDIITMVN